MTSVIMLGVTYKPFVPNIFMLNVPYAEFRYAECRCNTKISLQKAALRSKQNKFSKQKLFD